MFKRIALVVALFAATVVTIPHFERARAAFTIFQAAGVGASPPSLIFQGDSTKSISSITPSISCLQTGTLQTPAFIQCSASGTTASGSSNPFIDLQYVWTDNNPSPDTFTLPTIGTRSASKQNGPEYVQVFRAAGTYTITLTVSGCTSGHPATRYMGGGGACNGNAITTSTVTQTVTVVAWSGTELFFNTATGNDSNACTSSAPCLTPNRCSALIQAGNNIACNFDCGQTFNGDTGSGLTLTNSGANVSHARIVAGGPDCPGANPVISISSTANQCLTLTQNGAGNTFNDLVMSSINCTISGTATSVEGIGITGNNSATGSIQNIFLDQIAINDTLDIDGYIGVNTEKGSTSILSPFQGLVLWKVSTTTPVSALTTETGILGGAIFYAVVGGTQQGSGAFDPVRSHQIYMHCGGHCVARWVNTGPTCTPFPGCTPTRDLCVKASYDPSENGDGSTFTSSFWLITENYCESVAAISGPGNNNNDPTESTIDQYIAQQNVGFEISGGVFPAAGVNVTMRDNWLCLTGPNSIGVPLGQAFSGSADSAAEDSVLISNVYRNLYDSNVAVGSTPNLAIQYDENSPDTWTNPQRDFDNILETDNAAGVLVNIPSSNFTSIGSFVDFNTYFAPNATGDFLQNAGNGVSFAAWQALTWDVHGAVANPGFSSPSTCGFGAWPY
jgi:hypothetical protein